MGACYIQLGQPDRAIKAFRAALEIDPKLIDARNDLLFLMDQHPNVTPEEMRAEWRAWWRYHGEPWYAQRGHYLNRIDPERTLRVGYLSGDFLLHSAAIGFGPFVFRHSDAVIPYCYSNRSADKGDAVTDAFRQSSYFREIAGITNQQVIDCIRRDEIDILVDLAGNTSLNRLQVFAARPAPVQVTSWAHGTWMGMEKAFDAFWTDPVMVPAAERVGAPRTIDLPCIMAFEGPLFLDEPGPLPCLEKPVVFGSFNRALKINESVLKLWADILRRVPGSTILFKEPTFNAGVQKWVRDVMGELAPRIVFRPNLDVQAVHINTYREVDLALDPFPQTGGVTTLEGLHMGVPPVTLYGGRLNSRVSASFMEVLGLPEFIAYSAEDYVRLAVEWVTTRKHALSEIRAGLREQLEQSTLHGARFSPHVEAMYRTLWREWCAKSGV